MSVTAERYISVVHNRRWCRNTLVCQSLIPKNSNKPNLTVYVHAIYIIVHTNYITLYLASCTCFKPANVHVFLCTTPSPHLRRLYIRVASLSSSVYIVPVIVLTIAWNLTRFNELKTCYTTVSNYNIII